jgi:hypothetical protein
LTSLCRRSARRARVVVGAVVVVVEGALQGEG